VTGHGVFTIKSFRQQDFLLEYRGMLLDGAEADSNSFAYFFQSGNHKMW